MKKHILIRYLGALIVLTTFITTAILSPRPVSAAECNGVSTSLIDCSNDAKDEEGGVKHILSLVLDIFGIGIGILAVIGIAWAGIQYLTAGNDSAKAAKAKRRIFEVIIGVVCYVSIWGLAKWLLPGETVINAGGDTITTDDLIITYSRDNTVNTKRTLNVTTVTATAGDTTDKYTLSGGDKKIVKVSGQYYKCLSEGTTEITVTKGGKTATIPITCEAEDNNNGSTASSGQSSSG
ncbi:hypothetical protein IJG22_00310, partial [Candidatus Saccharibacteria bacterium]|nr:hypothetical protein [Candidatus Saccharibacteria bacterium]